MTPSLASLLLAALLAADAPAAENPVFAELVEQGIKMSDGSMVKLPPPIMPEGLDAAAQWAAIDTAMGNTDRRYLAKELVPKSYYAPVVVKVHNVKSPKSADDEGPAVRAVDTWFVVHGDWNTLTAKDFLENVMKSKDEGKSQVVLKSGALADEEMAKRKLIVANRDGYEQRFIYATFVLFDRVEVSATRFAAALTGKDFVLAAARVDPRFDDDPEYPNQWRSVDRDEQGEIKLGPPHPLAHAGGYSKITRLKEPADAVFIESHLVYEEPYAWFEGVNLVKQKVPLMVLEKVRVFRRKLGAASAESAEKKEKVRVLLTYGGHDFQEKPFFAMWDALPGVVYTKAKLPAAADLLKPGLEKDYDVLAMYDMTPGITPEQRQAFVALLNRGIGVVSLHHNLDAHPDWDEFRKIIGGKYLKTAREIDGKQYGPSHFAEGEDIHVLVADRQHPITAGIEDFQIHDEVYGDYYLSPDVKILLKTDHPKNNPSLAWVTQYGKSRVFYFQLGHGPSAWQNPNYPQILSNGIRWAAGK